jgi:acylglycerol lipase
MRHEEGRLDGVRGLSLYQQSWLPGAAARATVVVVHGFAEHGGRYSVLASRLVDSGYAVLAGDLRGHGRSGGRRTSVVRFSDYVDDLHALVASARVTNPAAPVFVLCHSMGGLIALCLALAHPSDIRGLVLSAPAVLPGRVPRIAVSAGRLMSHMAPNVGVLKLPLHRISRDPAVVAAYQNDPLVFATRMRARLGAEMLDAMRVVDEELPSLRAPLLVMQGSADGLVDPAGAPLVYERAGSADKTLKMYDGLWHEIFNEPEHDRVFDDLIEWLDARAA